MSKKIKLQDLSIANFDQQPDVEGIKGGGPRRRCTNKTICIPAWGGPFCYTYFTCEWDRFSPAWS